MPFESDKQRRAMYAAAEGKSNIGIPEKVGKEFVKHAHDSEESEIKADESEIANDGITELDVARGIKAGQLSSPQQYENIHLFDVRITGTGTSYREALNEYVYRPPEDFLNEDFLERCNGLPLIFEHPDSSILNTDEFRERSIGVIILPYIKGDEVWGIAKVFDDDAAELMQSSHISTSPAVVFRNAGSTETVDIDGETVLIEGKPSYLDHLAICENGVWDKGENPKGVTLTDDNEVSEMDEEKILEMIRKVMAESKADSDEKPEEVEEETKEEVKADEAEEGEVEKEVEETEGMTEAESGLEKAIEAHESEIVGSDEEKEEDKALEYADAAKENAELRALIKSMSAKIDGLNKPLSSADRDQLSKAQARADSVAQMFGEEVPAPLHGESPIAYRKRLADRFKKHSRDLKDVRMDSLDQSSFSVLEERIYADAQKAALSPTAATAGRLIPIVRRDSAGREVTTFQGDIDAWMSAFKRPGMGVKIDRTLGKGA